MSISFAILGANLCFIAVASKKNHSQVLPTYENSCVLGVVGSKITCLFCGKGVFLRHENINKELKKLRELRELKTIHFLI